MQNTTVLLGKLNNNNKYREVILVHIKYQNYIKLKNDMNCVPQNSANIKCTEVMLKKLKCLSFIFFFSAMWTVKYF